ncbi:MAG: carbohydrate-binding family 9-like protein [Roseiflexus sp.]
MSALPLQTVPRVPAYWSTDHDPFRWEWATLPAITPFILVDGSGPAIQQTVARLGYDPDALYVRFDCEDSDIWGTYRERDDPIYDEEAVELFISPGRETPVDYFEFEISPDGVFFDARIGNPREQRATLRVDAAWNADARWWSRREDDAGRWTAILALPWRCLTCDPLPLLWRANLFRIERPRSGIPEFSCWSPTFTSPADFHKPSCFGYLLLAE